MALTNKHMYTKIFYTYSELLYVSVNLCGHHQGYKVHGLDTLEV